ncbi:hypothetical protein DC498_08420 [Terrimonas sp.]|nr:hypothetical protein DC498_08420 [Terrimonas sp.]
MTGLFYVTYKKLYTSDNLLQSRRWRGGLILGAEREGNKQSPFVPMQAEEMQQRGCFFQMCFSSL